MFTSDQYSLVDFGFGRKLERFGRYLLDRPSPAATDFTFAEPSAWKRADARFDREASESGKWTTAISLPGKWCVTHEPMVLELAPTPFGHLGIFPEQAANWDWLADRINKAPHALKVLNLFAYTGGSTLAAAAAGAEVVHVDAAANTVGWARRNAVHSQLADRPIRWIAEDALKFARREVRRGNRYDAVILDPPSFGRGPKGEIWKLTEHLESLLAACAALTDGTPEFVLATCHTPELSAELLTAHMRRVFTDKQLAFAGGPLMLRAEVGRELPSGVVCQVTRNQKNV